MCPIPNGFQDRAIWKYNRKIVDKKEILRVCTVSNIGIYYSSDRVRTVCNKCSKIPPSTSVHFATHVKTWRVVRLSASWRSFMQAITSSMLTSSSSRVSTFFFWSYDRTKLPRLSAKWITKTTRWCSFGYTDCYVLSAWQSPISLYPTSVATSQWHFL